MNHESAHQYARRVINARGQSVMDVERTIIYCYDNPPSKPLVKVKASRNRPIYVSEQVFACLLHHANAMTEATGEAWRIEDVVESLLRERLKELSPRAWELHERFARESKALIDECKRNGVDIEHGEIMEAQ